MCLYQKKFKLRKGTKQKIEVSLYFPHLSTNPIQTVSLGQSLFFHFPPLLRDGQNYVVLLDSTLPKSQYDYVLPQVTFTAAGYHKHITLIFNPAVRRRRSPA